MKKIILNGCSWVAGDEIAWDLFCYEKNLIDEDYKTFNDRYHNTPTKSLYTEYKEVFRKNYCQAAYLEKYLNTEVVDLSSDGNSNDTICISTINYILGIPAEERKNYHVIIGWTLLQRLLMFLQPHWENIHVSHVDSKRLAKFKDRIMNTVIIPFNEDWYLNYVKNVLLLENFLFANNITFTFYRSLGTHSEICHKNFVNDLALKIKLPDELHSGIRLSNLTPSKLSSNNWLTFYPEHQNFGICSDSWTRYMEEHFTGQWMISTKNKHPNRKFTEKLSKIISDFIINQGVLD